MMRSVLVCVRTMLAAQAVQNAAVQLGLDEVISTAVNGAGALARVAQSPADVLLVDTASVRPDTVGFTRRVLEQTPEAVVVFFGPEEASVGQGAVAAGARGLIRGGEREDLVASVAKALMLLLRPNRGAQGVPLQRSEVETEEGADPEATTDTDAEAVVEGGTPVRAEAGAGTAVGVSGARRLALTERELQVMRGM